MVVRSEGFGDFFFFPIIVCAIYTGRPNSKINANIKATLHYIKLI